MRNYYIAQRVKEWALQDSNLRPSDYESVGGPSQSNSQLAFQRKAHGQAATVLATSRQQSATPRATHFQNPPDLYADSKIFLAWRMVA